MYFAPQYPTAVKITACNTCLKELSDLKWKDPNRRGFLCTRCRMTGVSEEQRRALIDEYRRLNTEEWTISYCGRYKIGPILREITTEKLL